MPKVTSAALGGQGGNECAEGCSPQSSPLAQLGLHALRARGEDSAARSQDLGRPLLRQHFPAFNSLLYHYLQAQVSVTWPHL